VSIWRTHHPTGKSARDEFGAILGDIRTFGKTTPNDRKRLRDLARAIGWSENSINSNTVIAREKH